ncbi:MAG: sugar transferase [Prevotellaceae bacterium]|nr:sugar transferase [Prevotellaceae bacterium]
MNDVQIHIKRLFDIVVAAVCIVLFFPLFAICYMAVVLEDGRPAIFRQERIGLHGKPFIIYKLRSMKMDAEANGYELSNSEYDSRLTRVGRFLRSHHLDELPQLWNVLKGDMSFIGPRPERQYFIDQIMQHDPRYQLLYALRPGVTSYATLYNGYTDTMDKMLRRLELDLQYLDRWSLWLDMTILWKTFTSIVFGKHF